MAEPKNHHYVPECYLKVFTNSNKEFWRLNKNHRTIKSCSPAMVCYEKDLFKIKKTETLIFNQISDSNYVEKVAFNEEENNYGKIIHDIVRFDQKPDIIEKDKYFLFLKMLVNIKRRNPTVRKDFMEKEYLKEYNSIMGQQKLKNYIQKLSEHAGDTINVDEYLKNYRSKYIDNDKLQDISLSAFFEKSDAPDLSNQVAKDLYRCKQFILHSPFGSNFITSDNPGFTEVHSGVLNFGGFGNQFRFYFPLSPKACLFINSTILEEKSLIEKSVNPIAIDKVIVNKINKTTFDLGKSIMLSNSKETLETFT